MGFVHANIIPILKEGVRQPYAGRLLLLGQGDIYFNLDYLRRIAGRAGFMLDEFVPIQPSHIPIFAEKGYPHGDTVFRMLGFSQISVLDYSAFDGADVVFDLNSPEVPEQLEGIFDVLIDHGTLEHVFHLPNALNNVFRLLKVGGRAIFSAPSGNFFDPARSLCPAKELGARHGSRATARRWSEGDRGHWQAAEAHKQVAA